MLPLTPPYAITDLAREHLEGRPPDGRPRRHRDPDAVFDESTALQPDPISMGIRNIVTNGPIGRLWRWNERRLEAREDRGHTSRVDDAVSTFSRPAPVGVARNIDDDRPERKVAA
ncbi:MAG: hypothetical protein H0V37_12215 [Chloroflexia bacterium]|nr:hypothetical protein [Chloroflexia bacterium]